MTREENDQLRKAADTVIDFVNDPGRQCTHYRLKAMRLIAEFARQETDEIDRICNDHGQPGHLPSVGS